MYDVIIIGAGVVGALTARELSKYSLKVCVVEKENDVGRGATAANSGIVHAGFDCKPGTLKARFNVRGNAMMAEICETLGVHYKNNGSIVVAFSDEEKETLQKLYEQGINNGVPELYIADKDELNNIEPAISDSAVAALVAPTGGIVCPYNLAIAAMGCAMDNGCELRTNFKVESVSQKDGFAEVKGNGEALTARFVINSAGVYSDDLSNDTDISVHPRKGEYMLLDKTAGSMVSHTVFVCPTKMGKGILVSPTVDGNLLLGPTAVDMDDKENTETTQEGLDAVAAGATKSIPGVPLRAVITSFTGLRSVGNSGDFIVKFTSESLLTLAGIESPGLSSSPAIAEYAVELLKKAGLKAEPNPDFIPGRKIYKAPETKYNRIICRCETVSEGEIISAIHTNPPAKDIFGIKKRTRAGMGRCQSGFCMPFVAEILARELDVPLTDITVSGAGSEILVSKVKGE